MLSLGVLTNLLVFHACMPGLMLTIWQIQPVCGKLSGHLQPILFPTSFEFEVSAYRCVFQIFWRILWDISLYVFCISSFTSSRLLTRRGAGFGFALHLMCQAIYSYGFCVIFCFLSVVQGLQDLQDLQENSFA